MEGKFNLISFNPLKKPLPYFSINLSFCIDILYRNEIYPKTL